MESSLFSFVRDSSDFFAVSRPSLSSMFCFVSSMVCLCIWATLDPEDSWRSLYSILSLAISGSWAFFSSDNRETLSLRIWFMVLVLSSSDWRFFTTTSMRALSEDLNLVFSLRALSSSSFFLSPSAASWQRFSSSVTLDSSSIFTPTKALDSSLLLDSTSFVALRLSRCLLTSPSDSASLSVRFRLALSRCSILASFTGRSLRSPCRRSSSASLLSAFCSRSPFSVSSWETLHLALS
mmetsp:Transcript_5363/g.18757  ORF Transcript_5363/g.18757 Transcript_5363/m.18757 type:complete len:237 (-) Transcript_5363:82-792(-)